MLARKYMYLRQKYARAFWKVNREVAYVCSGQNSNVHIWVMHNAVGGPSAAGSSRCQVSHIFVQYECTRITLSKVPRDLRNMFNRTKV